MVQILFYLAGKKVKTIEGDYIPTTEEIQEFCIEENWTLEDIYDISPSEIEVVVS